MPCTPPDREQPTMPPGSRQPILVGMTARHGCVILAAGLALVASGCDDEVRPKSVNLHEVNWADVTLPGSVCGTRHPIHLHRHRAVIVSTRWGRRVTVGSGWNPVVYGDLDGDGKDEAALVADCNNGGGTAAGVLAYAQVIFTAAQNSPRVLGVVTPQSPRTYGAPLLQVRIHRGKIVAHEAWYGPQ